MKEKARQLIISEYMRELQAKRRHPYHHFENKEAARAAQRKGIEARRAKSEEKAETLGTPKPEA
jgi:hypothetical protein